MLMSPERKFIFIEVPKTGTSAIAAKLIKIDPTLKRDILYLPDGTEERSASSHITAAEVRRRLGETADEYCFIGFLRDPVDQLLSKYFYYKIGRVKNDLSNGRANFGRVVRHYFARAVPLNLWVLLYPYKGAAHFVLDNDDKIQLDVIGNFKHLGQHFKEIFSKFGYSEKDLVLDQVNVSKYDYTPGKTFEATSSVSLRLHAGKDVDLFDVLPADGGIHIENPERFPAQ